MITPDVDSLSSQPVLSLRSLLIVAAVFHVAVTLSVFAVGRLGVLPRSVDANGIAVSFASDGVGFLREADQLAELLRRGQLSVWNSADSPVHLKLYSISIAILGPVFGSNILSAEPLNLFCYLAILSVTFRIGAHIFSRRVGLIAATSVAIWPSFLLHTTQLVKDPQYIACTLAFVLVVTLLLSQTPSWKRALLLMAIGSLLAVFSWVTRDSMGALQVALAMLGIVLLIVRQFREKRFYAANVVGIVITLLISAGVTQVIPKFVKQGPPGTIDRSGITTKKPSSERQVNADDPKKTQMNHWIRMLDHIDNVRHRFATEYPGAASNIDADVSIVSTSAFLKYLPRAAVIGFFAPFPNMWLSNGNQVGSAGRVFSGLEMIGIYVVEGLALVGLLAWRRAKKPALEYSVWLLALGAAVSVVALGVIVINVGTLYRLRYAYVILLVILAAEGGVKTWNWLRNRAAGRSGADWTRI
jgi:hypothetical protein